jgi:cysteinyl-tRNA synthetase
MGWFMDVLFESYPTEAVRLAIMTAHYGDPLDLNEPLVQAAQDLLDEWYGCLVELEPVPQSRPPQVVLEALLDDLNAPLAILLLRAIAEELKQTDDLADRRRIAADLKAGAGLLGVLKQDPATWLSGRRAG